MKGSSIVVKELGKGDRDLAARFVRRMIRSSMGSCSKEAVDHQISTAVRTLDLSIEDPDHYCMLALKDDKIIGIALGQSLGGVGRVDWIAVDPGHQRQGIGKRLMSAAEKQMKGRGCHKMTLFVFESQIPALGLYLKCGMVPEAVLKEHHWGDDYVVMSRWLEGKARRDD